MLQMYHLTGIKYLTILIYFVILLKVYLFELRHLLLRVRLASINFLLEATDFHETRP